MQTVGWIYNHIEDEEFVYELMDWIKELPQNRESVEDLMHATMIWDIAELYMALLERYKFLTPEEYENLKAKWKNIFILPLEDYLWD